MGTSLWPKAVHGWAVLGFTLSLVACGNVSCGPKKPEREPPSLAVKTKYLEAVERLQRNHLEGGWVVTRTIDGKPEHVGEGLIWSGVWLEAAPCNVGDATAEMLKDIILDNKGMLIRYSPLGEYENRPVTLDGALGLYAGVARRVEECNDGDRWGPAILAHLNYVNDNGGKLHKDSKATLVKEFTYVLDLLAYRLGLRSAPSVDRLRILETQLAAWNAAVMSSRSAAYRVHLGYLALETVERLGEKVNWLTFCATSNGVDIPLIDNRCGRGDLAGWVEAFQFNRWEYRHQRSGKWETPDGDGDETPGLDLLTAMRAAYAL